MSASVYRNEWGRWVGYCSECGITISGVVAGMDLWAEVHNRDNHNPMIVRHPRG